MHKLLARYLGKSAFLHAPEDGTGGGSEVATDPLTAPVAEATTLLGGDGDLSEEADPNAAPVAKTGDEETETEVEAEYVDDPNLSAEENAAKKKEFDEAKEKAKDEASDEGKDSPKAEDYEMIELPAGFDLNPEIEKEFRELAASKKWSQEDFKDLQELQTKLINKQSEAHVQRVKEWGDSLKTDKEIGGKALAQNIGAARAAMAEFFSPAAKSILDNTGLGNHPDIVRGFVRLGKAMGEQPTLKGGAVEAKITMADAMYPQSNGGDSKVER